MSGNRHPLSALRIDKLHVAFLSIYVLNCILVALAYWGNISGTLSNEYNLVEDTTNLYHAFEDSRFIFVGIIINIATAFTSSVDVLFDIFDYIHHKVENGDDDHDYISLPERTFLILLNIVTGLTLLFSSGDENIPYLYITIHALQFSGSMGIILLLCKKLIPQHFTTNRILFAQINFSLGTITTILGFGYDVSYWCNILNFFFLGLFFYTLLKEALIPWILAVKDRLMLGFDRMSVDELCALWYLSLTLLFMLFIPAVVSFLKLCVWSRFDRADVYVFIYSFVVFQILFSTVPGRIAKAVVHRERKLIQMKRDLIRYITHEVRSPLNVIYSGVKMMITDIADSLKEKKDLLELATSVSVSCEDLLRTVNDILLMESLTSNTFNISREMTPCAEMPSMIQHTGIMAKEKNVNFVVNTELPVPVAYPDDLVEDFVAAERESAAAEQALYVFIDKHKLVQVIRNLVTNSIKFTPPGESVSVNITQVPEIEPSLSERGSLVPQRHRSKLVDVLDEIDAPAVEDYYRDGSLLVEVVDTGVGIAEENFSKVFREFAQFDAHKLQGGGGSGLGLWISQEIIKHHGSKIHFHSDGEGCGTKFYFGLPTYKSLLHRQADPRVTAKPSSPIRSGSNGALVAVGEEDVNAPPLLPVTVPVAEDKRGGASPAAARAPAPSSRPLQAAGVCRLLVVDDSALNVKMMVRQLKGAQSRRPNLFQEKTCTAAAAAKVAEEAEEGPHPPPLQRVEMEIAEADDGLGAVALVRRAMEEGRPFDAVFMDSVMMHMQGPEAAQAMRAMGFEGLVVGVTGNVMADDVALYLQAGADRVLFKPVVVDELDTVLNMFVRR